MRLSWGTTYLYLFIVSSFIGAVRIFSGYELPQVIYDSLFSGIGLLAIILSLRKPVLLPDLAVAGFFCVVVVQLVNPHENNLLLKAYGTRTLLLYCLAYFIARRITLSESFRQKFYKMTWVLSIFIAIYAARQWLLPFPFEVSYASQDGVGTTFYGDVYQRAGNVFRIFGTFSSTTLLAGFQLYLGSLLIPLYVAGKISPRLFALGLGCVVFSVLLSYSRAALGSIVILLLSYYYVAIRVRGVRSISGGALLFVVGSVTIMLAMQFVPMLRDRIETSYRPTEVSSFQSRLDIWEERIDDVRNRPIGYGPGQSLYNRELGYRMVSDNYFLKLAIELGLPGLIMFLVFYGMPLIGFFKKTNGHLDPLRSGHEIFAWVVMPLLITGQLLDGFPMGFLFWGGLGLWVNARRVVK